MPAAREAASFGIKENEKQLWRSTCSRRKKKKLGGIAVVEAVAAVQISRTECSARRGGGLQKHNHSRYPLSSSSAAGTDIS